MGTEVMSRGGLLSVEEGAFIGTEEELYGYMARGLALITVQEKDLIVGGIRYRNNTIEPGIQFLLGYIFGVYDPATKEFSVYVFEYGGVRYYLGTAGSLTMVAKGSEGGGTIGTYALKVAADIDIYVFMATGTLNGVTADYTGGSAIIGLKAEDVNNLNWLATRVYEDQLTVIEKEAPPPQPAAEILGFIIRQA